MKSMRWAAEIKVGEHVASTKILGLTVSLDIVWSSLIAAAIVCLLYTSPSPRDGLLSRMPSSA